ncbi:MAG: ATP-binding protein [Acidobacteriota bacterium]|nr:ATP-binding protein [Acidobacteriota bacterium]
MIIFLLIFLTGPQQLTWYEVYERGERQFRKQDWAACIADMDKALAVRPEPKKNQITRAVQKIDYKPYYYKALACLKLGRIQEAAEYAGRSVEGEVVKNDLKLQADLIPVFQALRREALDVREEYREEAEIIDDRSRVLSYLEAGDLDRAEIELNARSNRREFDDLRRQLKLAQDALQARRDVDRQLTLRIEEAVTEGDKIMAAGLLNALGDRLPEATVVQLRQRIDDMPDPGVETEEPDSPPAITDQTGEIEQYKQLYAGAADRNLELVDQIDALERKNRNLQVQMARAAESEEPVIISFNTQLLMQVVRENEKELLVTAQAASPSRLVDWKLFHNGFPVDLPADAVQQDELNYAMEFRFPVESYGNHKIDLAVVDELASPEIRESVTVLVPRPFYLNPWLWRVLTGLVLVFLVWRMLRRMRLRKIARLRHFNPYIAGSPVRNIDMFYGRDDLIRRIQGLVHKNSFMIHGERRIGKTSLLLQLKKNLSELESNDYRFFPAFVDLQGIHEEDLFHHMMSEVIAQAGNWDISMEDLRFEETNGGYVGRQFARDMKTIIGRLKDRYERHVMVVLLVDEVDCLNEFGEKTNQKLRGIFMKDFAEHLTCVMAGIHLKKEWESSGSPWYNFFEEIPVHHIDEQDARELIIGPVKGIFRYRADAVDLIINATGGHPYLIQKICVSLIGHKLNDNKFVISREDVAGVLANMGEELKRNQDGIYR